MDTAAVSGNTCTCLIQIIHAVFVFRAHTHKYTLEFTDVSSELEAKLKQELEHTERLDTHFVEYLRSRDMAPASRSDSAAGSLQHTYELLSPELQVKAWKTPVIGWTFFFHCSFVTFF